MKLKLVALSLFALLLTGCFPKPRPCPKPVPAPPAVKEAKPVVETPAPKHENVVKPLPLPVRETPVDYAALFKANVVDVLFDFDKSDIRADQWSALNHTIIFLQEHPTLKFKLVGSADVIGSDSYNEQLSQRRVEHVATVLQGANVNPDSLAGIGKTSTYCSAGGIGQKMPKSKAAASCLQSNRRVHFVYNGTE